MGNSISLRGTASLPSRSFFLVTRVYVCLWSLFALRASLQTVLKPLATRDTADAHYSRLSLLVPKTLLPKAPTTLASSPRGPLQLWRNESEVMPQWSGRLGGGGERQKIKMGRKNFVRCHGGGGGRGEAEVMTQQRERLSPPYLNSSRCSVPTAVTHSRTRARQVCCEQDE